MWLKYSVYLGLLSQCLCLLLRWWKDRVGFRDGRQVSVTSSGSLWARSVKAAPVEATSLRLLFSPFFTYTGALWFSLAVRCKNRIGLYSAFIILFYWNNQHKMQCKKRLNAQLKLLKLLFFQFLSPILFVKVVSEVVSSLCICSILINELGTINL